MKKLSGSFGLKACAVAIISAALPLQASAAMSTLTVINDLRNIKDTLNLGPTATPVAINFYAAAGVATAPCDKIVNLVPGASYTTTVGGKCSAINHFTVTPLASTVSGFMFPFGTTTFDNTISATTPAVEYVIAVSGAGTAATGGALLNGVPIPCTAGTPAGSGDSSLPAVLDTSAATKSGMVLCEGTPQAWLLPTVR